MATKQIHARICLFASIAIWLFAVSGARLVAEPLVVHLDAPPATNAEGFHMGTASNPAGNYIGINSQHLTYNGKPWMPVMGEFHFSRCPAEEWREELLRMKAGGINIAATYVFWNHHEEAENQWNWSGQRNLRKFIELCNEVGLLAAVRVGPWCHGEVRNGGIPDWALEKGWRVRSNDKGYLKHVKILYGQIAKQLKDLLWKEGGPVMAIQLENEYRGPAEHLLALKEIAREVGLDVPLYTRTGWPNLGSPMPFGEIAPLYGAYAEGFWDRRLRSMPGKYWAAFHFMHVRTDSAIATEQLGERAIRDEQGVAEYPFLTCELGGGMMSSYHRRILMHPEDIEAVALTKVGSGGNLPGYYMYHGGVNPEGQLTTLMEQQATPMTNYNDMPVKNYDFQAPLGSFGQVRPHYHGLRRMHLLFNDFGAQLAPMASYLPEKLSKGKSDLSTLRWAVRSDGTEGFVFVNNHQRGKTLRSHSNVQFAIKTADADLTFPKEPIAIGSGTRFIWPFQLNLGGELRLESATAQLICKIEAEKSLTLFFAETPGVPACFVFSDGTVRTIQPSRDVALKLKNNNREIEIVVLNEADSLALWKGTLQGRKRVVLTFADVLFDNGELELRSEDPQQLTAWAYPPIEKDSERDGMFGKLALAKIEPISYQLAVKQIQEAGQLREIPIGRQKVAVAPSDDEFKAAAVWNIELPENLDPNVSDVLLRIHYQGDVARVKIGDKLVMDDFYNGRPLEVGLRRFISDLKKTGEFTLQILPFQSNSPIFLPDKTVTGEMLSLDSVELVPRYHLRLEIKP